MNLKRTQMAGIIFALLGISSIGAAPSPLMAQDQPAAGPKYTRPEYDAEQAAANEKNPQTKIKLLDDFVAKYPNSELLIYVYPEYIKAYQATRDWKKVVDSEDKLLSFPSLDKGTRIQALYTRSATAEFAINLKDPSVKEQLTKAREAAAQGLKELNDFAKPAGATDEQFVAFKKLYTTQFNNTLGFATWQLKDFSSATDALKASLAGDPTQPVATYRLGQAYLQSTPPQSLEGFWALARAIALKIPNGQIVQKYLRQEMANYQLPSCDSQIDSQLKELLALAASTPDRPATYSIPSAADLAKVRESANIATVLADLKGGGDKGKLTWLAVCSGEFPEALGKVFEVTPGTDSVVVKAYAGTTEDEVKAGAAPNVELKIDGHPEVARLEKDGLFRFGGALVDYTPDPLNMKWEKVKINPEDIPEEKKTPAKHPAKTPAKHPAKKPA
jgi:hypothetical protein